MPDTFGYALPDEYAAMFVRFRSSRCGLASAKSGWVYPSQPKTV
jgi:hypothetical protein